MRVHRENKPEHSKTTFTCTFSLYMHWKAFVTRQDGQRFHTFCTPQMHTHTHTNIPHKHIKFPLGFYNLNRTVCGLVLKYPSRYVVPYFTHSHRYIGTYEMREIYLKFKIYIARKASPGEQYIFYTQIYLPQKYTWRIVRETII